MRALSTVFCILIFGCSFAQTKLISHKSHSGSDENFRIALENNLFDSGNSNLGAAPDRYERNAKLDSVIYVSDQKAILITSQYCVTSSRKEYKIIESKTWNAGREEVYYSNLFSKKHSLDSIKKVLKEQYSFRSDIDKVVFVGYDNGEKPEKKSKSKKKSVVPFFMSDDNSPSKPFLILILTVLSSIMAFFVWKTTTFKTSFSN